MTIPRNTAQRLCTAAEFELVEASYPASAKQLSPARLRQKVQRARKLRDKYRDLAKRQRLEMRGKREASSRRPAQGHENTDRKAELFQEVLDRFETQLSRTGDGDGQPDAGKAGAKKAGAKKAGAKKAGAKKAGAKKAGARKAGAGEASAEDAGPAAGGARPAAPGRPGAAALKGARQRPDSAQAAQAKVSRAHNRASNRRSQTTRDTRGR
jgi:hypothetical protein